MSVVPMKMLTVAGPAAQIDEIICTCLVNEQFHPLEATHISGSDGHMMPFTWNNPWQEPLGTAEKLLETMGISLGFEDFRSEQLTFQNAKDYLDKASSVLTAYAER